MPERGLDLETIAHLIRLVETRGLEELGVEVEGARVTVRRHAQSAHGEEVHPHPLVAHPAAEREQHAAAGPPEHPREVLVSPMVGVFYRAPSPDEPAFVEVGDHVEVGQTVGIIEAMKVFSEIPAERAGVCVAIAAESGQLVQAGDPLIYLSQEL